MTGLTEQQRADLDVARYLAACGIPIFLGTPDATKTLGFALPNEWQQTVADPGVVDLWEPGMALCAVMGCGLDAVDIDPRNGGHISALGELMPAVYAIAATPSDGWHNFVASLGVGSLDNTFPGIDVKGGQSDGESRGFVFIAPTVRKSKVTGEWVAYRWGRAPDLTGLNGGDRTGAALAARILQKRGSSSSGGKKKVTGGSEKYQAWANSRAPQSAPAADKAISVKLSEVADWTPQDGIDFRLVLLKAAFTLGGYVGGKHLDEADARERLDKAVSEVWGCPDGDDLKWIEQGLRDGAAQPFHVYTAEQAHQFSDAAQAVAAQGETPPEPRWSVLSVLGTEPFDPALDSSDQGLAKAVAYRMLPALRYATDADTWVMRERDVWEQPPKDQSEWAISILAELMPLGDPDLPKKKEDYTADNWTAHRRNRFMNAAGAGPIARKLRSILSGDHPSCLKIAALDANPEVLWAGGVPWDLRASGDIPTAARVDTGTPHLRTAMCAPDPTCPTPRWDAFVRAVLPDREVRAWAMRVLSIALTGHADAALPILYGPERSGKTSLVEMLVEVLGSYAHAASAKLLSPHDNSHPEIYFDLKGRRLSFIDEGPRRGHDATERLKQITGGGSLTGRAVYTKSVTFKPSHTLVMTTNPEPHLTDPALRARMRLIPCNAAESVVRPARLALLGSGLIDEAPGILAAMMREAAGYLADRDSASNASAPAVIRELVRTLAEGQDPVREWVENCTVPADPGTPGRVLYTAFAQWHQVSPIFRKLTLPTESAFGRTLTEMGTLPKKTSGLSYRPLSVLGWTGGAMPTVPTPAAFLGQPGLGGRGEGGSGEG